MEHSCHKVMNVKQAHCNAITVLCRYFCAYQSYSSIAVCGDTLPFSASKPEALACCTCTG